MRSPEVTDSSDDDEPGEEDSSDEDAGSDDEDKYDVKCIHDKRGRGKTLSYLVEWDGYAEQTWEPAALLRGTIAMGEWEAARKS